MFTSLKRILNSGWTGFKRQAGLSIATVFIMTLVISTITSLFLFHRVSQFVVSALQDRVDISVYFKKIMPEPEILKIRNEIAEIPEVKSVEYISQQEAAKRLVERRPDLAESVAEAQDFLNIASLNIKVYEASEYSAVANFLQNSSFSEKINVDYYERKPVIDKIVAITTAVNRFGFVISVILGVIAFLVAFNQIKLAILHSKEEISIQRLVGASNWFIRGPFLVQGIIVGIFATIVSFLIFLVSLAFLSPKAEILFPGLNLFSYFLSNLSLILLIQFGAGIALGIVSSTIAMRKYLEV